MVVTFPKVERSSNGTSPRKWRTKASGVEIFQYKHAIVGNRRWRGGYFGDEAEAAGYNEKHRTVIRDWQNEQTHKPTGT